MAIGIAPDSLLAHGDVPRLTIYEPEILFRRAHLRLEQDRQAEAEQYFARAVKLLEELGDKDHALRKLMLAEWSNRAKRPDGKAD